MFGYSLNYLIDTQGSVIVDVEATPTRISKEVDATETMIERIEACFPLELAQAFRYAPVHGGAALGHRPSISRRMSANSALETATSVS